MVIPLVAKTTDLGGRNVFLELAFLHYGSSLKLVAVLKKALWRGSSESSIWLGFMTQNTSSFLFL